MSSECSRTCVPRFNHAAGKEQDGQTMDKTNETGSPACRADAAGRDFPRNFGQRMVGMLRTWSKSEGIRGEHQILCIVCSCRGTRRLWWWRRRRRNGGQCQSTSTRRRSPESCTCATGTCADGRTRCRHSDRRAAQAAAGVELAHACSRALSRPCACARPCAFARSGTFTEPDTFTRSRTLAEPGTFA